MLPNARGSDEKIPLFVTNQSVEEIATLSQTTHQPGSDAIVEEAKAAGDTLYRQQNGRKHETRNWEDVLRNTATVLLADPKSAKALYRAARALNELKRSEEAYDCCTRALKLEPHNTVETFGLG
ncbi:hypothetical protein RhiLY_12890 [Ceratobasidium sp. AG-Ba]|nr:hypothetical protein RhiLY_12890 [Ceratobasidium sp. AG-Ba]